MVGGVAILTRRCRCGGRPLLEFFGVLVFSLSTFFFRVVNVKYVREHTQNLTTPPTGLNMEPYADSLAVNL
jgi:hypothetical protein